MWYPFEGAHPKLITTLVTVELCHRNKLFIPNILKAYLSALPKWTVLSLLIVTLTYTFCLSQRRCPQESSQLCPIPDVAYLQKQMLQLFLCWFAGLILTFLFVVLTCVCQPVLPLRIGMALDQLSLPWRSHNVPQECPVEICVWRHLPLDQFYFFFSSTERKKIPIRYNFLCLQLCVVVAKAKG